MKRLSVLLIMLLFAFTLFAQAEKDSVKTETMAPPPPPPQKMASKIYYGGTLGFSFFGDVKRLSLEPIVGYKITPQFSAGVKIRYEWLKYDVTYLNQTSTLNTTNYGGSIFARYRVIPQVFLHAEYAQLSYEYYSPTFNDPNNTERDGVPFLLLGGGLSQSIGGNAWAYVEILFDVIQDEKSPYKSGEPFISIGAGVGF